MPIIVYSKPSCVQCDATYRAMDKAGLTYTKVDVTQDAHAYEFVSDLGYKQAPVVYVDPERHWSGFRPDLIEAITS